MAKETKAPENEGVAIVAKLTPATMKFNAAAAKSTGKKTFLGRIAGIADGLKIVKATNGDVHTAITGTFIGVNGETGAQYRSGVLYLPTGIHDLVQNAVDAGLDDDGKPLPYNAVEFGIDLHSVPSNNLSGYSYEANPVIQAKESDPASELLARMAETKALPAVKASKSDD